MITCRNLSVAYGRKILLDQLSFSVQKGELVVIIGKNGSGKTTLLRALSGAVPYKGEILLEGKPLASVSPAKRARIMAVMPQTLPQPTITLRNLVAFGRHPHTGSSGILSRDDWAVVDEMIALTGLAPLQDMPVDKLSGGERRKAFFAMALTQKAHLLLADEPCANLDPEYSKYMLSMLQARKAAGDTVLCVLHDINEAFAIADRLLVIDKGQLIFDGTPKQAALQNIPQKLFSLSPLTCYDEAGHSTVLYR